ncbi:single-stranded DNA-binding protein [Isoptericola aurantiacus]|uniref:single-stranded DNA-binding protein n=1 Tax=Isoptericola aurantiacus TaxID=3377839 RepID=UPI00383BE0EE
MSQATVTVTGYVGTTPPLHLSASAVPWTSFRVASTRRVRDPQSGEWHDGRTTWFTVKAFGRAARTVSTSLVQGQPVVVTGRLSSEEWVDRDGRDRVALVVEADAVGPDATRGLTSYAKVVLDDAADASGRQGVSPDAWNVPTVPTDPRDLTGPEGAAPGAPEGDPDESSGSDGLVDAGADDADLDGTDLDDALTGAPRGTAEDPALVGP